MLIYAPCVSHYLQYRYGVARTESSTATADPPPNEWKRYVNKTHTIPEEGTLTGLQTHIDSIDKCIKWTTEGEVETTVEKNGIEKKKKTLDFLDTVYVTVLQEVTARSTLESSAKKPND